MSWTVFRVVCPSEETDMTTNLDDLSALVLVPRELEESSRFLCSSCCWIVWNCCWRAFFCHENNLRVWVSTHILKPWPRNSLSFHCSRAGWGGEITMNNKRHVEQINLPCSINVAVKDGENAGTMFLLFDSRIFPWNQEVSQLWIFLKFGCLTTLSLTKACHDM
jgi:hypothetical protein